MSSTWVVEGWENGGYLTLYRGESALRALTTFRRARRQYRHVIIEWRL